MKPIKELTKEEIHEKLIEWCKKYKYPQGDDYYAGMTKTHKWYVGYSNDYPMQHSRGKKFILTPEEYNQAMEDN